MSEKSKTVEYVEKILQDGHLSLSAKVKKGRDVFRLLGRDASKGKLENASVKHDEYIYGKCLLHK